MTEGAPYIAVVPRGETRTYQTLRASTKDPSVIDVIWDRRATNRRQAQATVPANRRLGDRRRPPHDTWTLGFIVASRTGAALEPCKTIPRPEEP